MKRILIVDDDRDIAARMKEVLEHQLPGAIIHSRTSAESAIELIRDQAEFDLVISDYEIDTNKKGGDRVAQAAKERSPETMVMICSGALDSRNEEIMRCGADFYLMKPYYINEFLCLVSQLLGLNAPQPILARDCC